MNGHVLVSVIVPNYNHAPYLKQRFDSILGQSIQDIEIIILDDCSSDNSREIIEQYRSNGKVSHVVYNEQNGGTTFKQWQKGIGLATGDYIWIAESDDYADPLFLERLLPNFNNKEIVLAFARSFDVNAMSELMGLSYEQLDWNKQDILMNGASFVEAYMYRQCTIPNVSAVLFRKQHFQNSFLGLDYRLCGDWFFYLNMLTSGSIAYNATPLNYHRFHTNNVRSAHKNGLLALNERLRILDYISSAYTINGNKLQSSLRFQIQLFGEQVQLKDLVSIKQWASIVRLFGYDINKYFMLIAVVVKRLYRSITKRKKTD